MERVVYYARVSTEEEKQKNALETQCYELEEFIKNNKKEEWTLVDKYVDEGKTATTTKVREDFMRLLADMQANKFDVIVIKILDRGWRNSYDWKVFEKMLIANTKKLFIYTRNAYYDYTNPMDFLATGMEAQFAEWFSVNQSVKMNSAHKTRMKKGTVVTNGKLWGYNQVNAQLVINKEEAEIVRFIFEEYADGKGFRTIAKELDKMGIKNQKGNPFALTTLKRMIKQEKYKGTLICGKTHRNYWTKKIEKVPESEWIIHEDAVPAIVSKELWEKANKVLENKRKEYNLEDKRMIAGYFNGKYPLSGKITCGLCGRPYYHSKYSHNTFVRWECKGYREFGVKAENGCSNIKLPDTEINQVVKAVIFEFWKNKDSSIERIIKVLDKVLDNNDYEPQIKSLTKQITKIKNYKRKARNELYDETITKEEYEEDIKSFDADLLSLEGRLKALSKKCDATVDKKQRLENIKNKLNIEITDINSITDEIIEAMVQSVIVKPNNSLQVTLNGDFSFDIDRDNENYQNVTASGQNRYTYTGSNVKVCGVRK